MKAARYIEFNEGYRRHVYDDTEGIPTIGIGFNLEAGFSREESRLILEYRINKIVRQLRWGLPVFNALDNVRQLVLIDMAYNLGVSGLGGFKKMLAALDRKEWDTAAEELLDSRYASQVGPRATRNADMLRTGVAYEVET
jgi:lysozyme